MKSDDNPLSDRQVKLLGALAREAFALQSKLGLLDLPAEVASDTKSNQAKFWRQRERAAETGHTELADCRQRHFNGLLARFEQLAGKTGQSYNTRLREAKASASTTPAGAALLREMWQLCKLGGLGEAYVLAIIKPKYKTSDVNDLSMGQLQGLIATIRRRVESKLKRPVEAESSPPQAQAQTQADEGVRTPAAKGREYVLRPRVRPAGADADNIPF